MSTVVEQKTDADRDQRIESLEHKVDHLEQLLERMQVVQERAVWEDRIRRSGF